jgi:hypothetical protein
MGEMEAMESGAWLPSRPTGAGVKNAHAAASCIMDEEDFISYILPKLLLVMHSDGKVRWALNSILTHECWHVAGDERTTEVLGPHLAVHVVRGIVITLEK